MKPSERLQSAGFSSTLAATKVLTHRIPVLWRFLDAVGVLSVTIEKLLIVPQSQVSQWRTGARRLPYPTEILLTNVAVDAFRSIIEDFESGTLEKGIKANLEPGHSLLPDWKEKLTNHFADINELQLEQIARVQGLPNEEWDAATTLAVERGLYKEEEVAHLRGLVQSRKSPKENAAAWQKKAADFKKSRGTKKK